MVMLSEVLAVPRDVNVRLDAPSARIGSDVGELEVVRLTVPENALRLVRVIWTSPEPVIGIVREEGETVTEKSGEGLAAGTAQICRPSTKMNVTGRMVKRDSRDAMSHIFSISCLTRFGCLIKEDIVFRAFRLSEIS
jgi:hypothetical protein